MMREGGKIKGWWRVAQEEGGVCVAMEEEGRKKKKKKKEKERKIEKKINKRLVTDTTIGQKVLFHSSMNHNGELCGHFLIIEEFRRKPLKMGNHI